MKIKNKQKKSLKLQVFEIYFRIYNDATLHFVVDFNVRAAVVVVIIMHI